MPTKAIKSATHDFCIISLTTIKGEGRRAPDFAEGKDALPAFPLVTGWPQVSYDSIRGEAYELPCFDIIKHPPIGPATIIDLDVMACPISEVFFPESLREETEMQIALPVFLVWDDLADEMIPMA